MADLNDAEIYGPANDPELSDLEAVIVNVQTVRGEQFSMVIAAEGMKMSMTHGLDGDSSSEVQKFTILREIR